MRSTIDDRIGELLALEAFRLYLASKPHGCDIPEIDGDSRLEWACYAARLPDRGTRAALLVHLERFKRSLDRRIAHDAERLRQGVEIGAERRALLEAHRRDSRPVSRL